MHRSTDLDHADIVAAAVLACTLPKAAWTHEAHLAFGYATVRRHGVMDALPILRASIRRYNESTGVANTESSGYHETLTAYYCGAVALLQRDGHLLDDVVVHPLTSRVAPFEYWDRDLLMATPARLRWLEPARPLAFDAEFAASSGTGRSATDGADGADLVLRDL